MFKVQITHAIANGPIKTFDYGGYIEDAVKFYEKLEKLTISPSMIVLSLVIDGTEIPLMSRRYK